MPPARKIEGWKAIAARIAEQLGLSVSVNQARRYEFGRPPLPVQRLQLAGRRQRVLIGESALTAWIAVAAVAVGRRERTATATATGAAAGLPDDADTRDDAEEEEHRHRESGVSVHA